MKFKFVALSFRIILIWITIVAIKIISSFIFFRLYFPSPPRVQFRGIRDKQLIFLLLAFSVFPFHRFNGISIFNACHCRPILTIARSASLLACHPASCLSFDAVNLYLNLGDIHTININTFFCSFWDYLSLLSCCVVRCPSFVLYLVGYRNCILHSV